MKKLILLVSFSMLAGGCAIFRQPEPEAITVELRGTPGLSVHGFYVVDGREHWVRGAVPMNVKADGRLFQLEFQKEGDGVLTAVLNKSGRQYGEARSQSENGGVRAKISPGEVFDLTSTTGF